jgi:hypothetical protein
MYKIFFYTLSFIFSSTILSAQGMLPSLLTKEIDKGTRLFQKRIKFQKKKKLQDPGKIYNFGKTLYINDKNRGVHIVDNSNPRQPIFKQFLKIPGNYDIAIKGQILYADNYEDLVIVNLQTKEIKRINNVFPQSAAKYRKEQKAQVNNLKSQAVQQNIAQAGSMARFGIYNNHLYVLDERKMKIFNISDWRSVHKVNERQMRFIVETVFSYGQSLFIGGQEGVYIYDVENPANPVQQDIFSHALACDPVVVDDHTAYITLRVGRCRGGSVNQLDVVDVQNPAKAKLLHSLVLDQPRGLAVADNWLYLCNQNRLELYSIGLDKKPTLINSFPIDEAYDVLYLKDRKLIVVVGKDAVYQIARRNNELILLSKIDAKRPQDFNIEQLPTLNLSTLF